MLAIHENRQQATKIMSGHNKINIERYSVISWIMRSTFIVMVSIKMNGFSVGGVMY